LLGSSVTTVLALATVDSVVMWTLVHVVSVLMPEYRK
jgi:hypothetical protein